MVQGLGGADGSGAVILPLEIGQAGRVRFEPVDSKVLRARVQASFDSHVAAGLVRFRSDRVLPRGSYRAFELEGGGEFRLTAYVAEHKNARGGETFWVRRSGGQLGNASQLAGPFSTFPFTPVPAEIALPIPQPQLGEQARKPVRFPEKERPLDLPPGVPAFPQILGGQVGRPGLGAAILGSLRGFGQQAGGGQLAAA